MEPSGERALLFAPPASQRAHSDVLMYNALIEVAIYRRQHGTPAAVLAEMDQHGVVPDAATLALLLQTFTAAQWADNATEPRLLVERFRTQYRVRRDLACALVEVQCLARVGMTRAVQELFVAVPALRGRRDAWLAFVEAHTHNGRLQEAAALLGTMAREGQRPDVTFANVILAAARDKGLTGAPLGAVVDAVLAQMREWRVEPSPETVELLSRSTKD